MNFIIEGRCVLELEHQQGWPKSQHVATSFNLDVSNNLQRERYLDEEDLPTAEGSKTLTNVFVQGLIGNIHHAHDKGYWNDAEHIRYIISELERGFVQIAETSKGTF